MVKITAFILWIIYIFFKVLRTKNTNSSRSVYSGEEFASCEVGPEFLTFYLEELRA
jgi:hypothetical protein